MARVLLYNISPEKAVRIRLAAFRHGMSCVAVEPAASLLEGFRGRDLAVINLEPTPADSRAALVIRGDAAEVFAALEAEERDLR